MSIADRSALGEAIWEHDSEAIETLVAAGEGLKEGEHPIRLIADGMSVASMDRFSKQSEVHIGKALNALRTAGIDLDAPIEGEPPAFFLTKRYSRRYMSSRLDTSYEAMVGMTDRDHLKYLAVFARAGVDFSKRNEAGESFVTFGHRVAEDYARTREPRIFKPDYEPYHDCQPRPIAQIMKSFDRDILEVKRAAQEHEILARTDKRPETGDRSASRTKERSDIAR